MPAVNPIGFLCQFLRQADWLMSTYNAVAVQRNHLLASVRHAPLFIHSCWLDWHLRSRVSGSELWCFGWRGVYTRRSWCLELLSILHAW